MRQRRLVHYVNDAPRWMMSVVVVLLVGMGWIWLTRGQDWPSMDDQAASPREGFLAPDFSLDGLNDESVTLSDLRGKIVIVNIWASWCPPCRAEMPALQRVYDDYQDRGVEILAVNAAHQDSEKDAIAFVEEIGLSFPILFDRTGGTSRKYQLRAMPSTYIVDHEGMIQKVILGGPISEATFQTAVEELMRERP